MDDLQNLLTSRQAFRAKKIFEDTWIIGMLRHFVSGLWQIEGRNGLCIEIDPNTLSMQIGMTDINSIMIFTNHIVKITAFDENGLILGTEICVVTFERCAFTFAPDITYRGLTLNDLHKRYKAHHLELEVIGNRFDDNVILVQEEEKRRKFAANACEAMGVEA